MLLASVPGEELVKSAMQESWTAEKMGGVLVVAITIVVSFMVYSQSLQIKRLINNFQKTNDMLLKTNNDIAENNQKQMQALTNAVNELSTETRKDIEQLSDRLEGIDRKVDDIGKRSQTNHH